NKKAFTYHYQKSFIPEDLPALCHKELERGHTAVLFYSKHPCFRVRMATMNPLVLFFGNIIYKFACNDINKSANIILYLYNKNLDWLLKNIINLVAMAYYSYGVKEALRWKKRNLVIVE
ncbi:MAG TPA: hypothetical protein PL110_20870, partial [Candidatus Eremiobacteraeota bacterium]|nr:hypothetical protein [Candidatus Eremiobacteraeota bacterium]